MEITPSPLVVITILLVGFALAATCYTLLISKFQIHNLSWQERMEAAIAGRSEKDPLWLKIASSLSGIVPLKREAKKELADRLGKAGINMDAETWHGLRLTVPFFGIIVAFIITAVLSGITGSFIYGIISGAIILVCSIGGPEFYLRDKTKKRKFQIESEMAADLEMLSITVRAGYPLTRGFQLIGNKTEGALAEEFRRVDSDINRLGMDSERALNRMRARSTSQMLNSFAMSVIHALRQGTSISRTLEAQAKLALNEHYNRTMIRVNKLPGKMTPIIFVCFLPSIVVLALAPMIANAIGAFTQFF